MVIRLIAFLMGFGLMIVGFVYIILYLNLMSLGLSFADYLLFIAQRVECWFAIIGLTMITLAIYVKPKESLYDVYK